MADETEKTEEESNTEENAANKAGGKNIPPHLQGQFGKSENAVALRAGFRNPSNKNSKSQRKKKRRR